MGRRRGASVRRPPWGMRLWRRVRRPLRITGGLLALGTLGVGAYWGGEAVLAADALRLQQVVVHGSLEQLSAADLEGLLAGALESNFFALDLVALQETLVAEPWIAQASLRRRWPLALEVALEERRAVAHWGGEMLSPGGQRFRPGRFRRLESWPRLSGPDQSEARVWQVYRRTSQRLATVSLKVLALQQSEHHAWRLELDNGIALLLGREALWERLERFIRVYPRVLAPRVADIDHVDLRYSDGFAVRWKPLTSG
ncbi:MAG: cell division protein FtsQ/DivIB [Candidatus Competibacterales bacterium]